MKRFILMIISVSVFFIGLGGIVKHVGAKFASGLNSQRVFLKTPVLIDDEEKINFEKSPTFLEKSKRPLIIKRTKNETAGDHLELNLRVPNQPDRIIILPREKSTQPSLQGAEFPRIENNNAIIFNRPEHEGPRGSDSNKDEEKSTRRRQ